VYERRREVETLWKCIIKKTISIYW
jgi:hypothetical protein